MEKTHPAPNLSLAVLSSCYFILAVASLAVIGLLVPMAEGLSATKSEIAYLVAAFSITNAIAAPVLQTVVGDWDRRWVILIGLVGIAIGTAITAIATQYGVAVLGRMILAVGAAIVGPMASSAGASLVDVSQRGMALGKVFAGMTIATVSGVPLTAVGGDLIGWRATLLVIAAFALVIGVAVWALVPETERGNRARLADIREILTDRILAPAISVTAFQMAGQLATYAVIAVYLVEWLQMPSEWLPFALITFGVGGIAGNIFAMRMVDRIGPDVLILGSLMCTGVVFVGIQVTVAIPWIVFSLLGAWAVASMVLFAPQQTRLIGMRPEMANLLLALNGSAVYGGMAVGSAVGGYVYGAVGVFWLAPTSAIFVVLAIGAFFLSKR
jgi:DHA1 family inner membrane transport protein